MPKEKNHFLRAFIPVMLIMVGIGVAFAVFTNSKNSSATTPAQTVAAAGTQTAAAPTAAPTTPPAATEQPAGTPPAAVDAAKPQETPGGVPAKPAYTSLKYHVEPAPAGGTLVALGGLDRTGTALAKVEFSPFGAGVQSITLAHHFDTIKDVHQIVVQKEVQLTTGQGVLTPFAATKIVVTPAGGEESTVYLFGQDVWRPIAGKPGAFEAIIADNNDVPALRIERAYTLPDGSLDLTVSQKVENLSDFPLSVQWVQLGPVEMFAEAGGYAGDRRRLRFGYVLPAKNDPAQTVLAERFTMSHDKAIGKPDKATQLLKETMPLWPNEDSTKAGYGLVWAGVSNRYFGAAAYPMPGGEKAFGWVGAVDRVLIDPLGAQQSMALRLQSVKMDLGPRGSKTPTADFSHMVYAGPLDRTALRANPVTNNAGLPGLVVFNLGGPCSFCTFEFMTGILLWIMHTLHNVMLHDWALSIVGLVLIVRSCLHPVTKWSQIKMARFGKQMQGVGPKQKKLQEMYRDDPKKLQVETAKLWREEGVSPLSFLGCLPMMLQMPVWIALYASLYFSVELRHEGAFYGIFQRMIPQTSKMWYFLGDLSEPDRFWYFGKTVFTIPLIGAPIDSINLLPMLLAVVFFIQQKYMTPTTPVTTPEQAQQQKVMRWMTVVLFPVMMYKAPSGLAIYFLCNSTFAILESMYIRKHMEKHGLLDLDKMRAERQAKMSQSTLMDRNGNKVPANEGFIARLQRMAMEKQKEAMKIQSQKKNKRY